MGTTIGLQNTEVLLRVPSSPAAQTWYSSQLQSWQTSVVEPAAAFDSLHPQGWLQATLPRDRCPWRTQECGTFSLTCLGLLHFGCSWDAHQKLLCCSQGTRWTLVLCPSCHLQRASSWTYTGGPPCQRPKSRRCWPNGSRSRSCYFFQAPLDICSLCCWLSQPCILKINWYIKGRIKGREGNSHVYITFWAVQHCIHCILYKYCIALWVKQWKLGRETSSQSSEMRYIYIWYLQIWNYELLTHSLTHWLTGVGARRWYCI